MYWLRIAYGKLHETYVMARFRYRFWRMKKVDKVLDRCQ